MHYAIGLDWMFMAQGLLRPKSAKNKDYCNEGKLEERTLVVRVENEI